MAASPADSATSNGSHEPAVSRNSRSPLANARFSLSSPSANARVSLVGSAAVEICEDILLTNQSRALQEPVYILPKQREVKLFYENEKVQRVVAGIIVLNFVVSILQREIDPFSEGDPRKIKAGDESALPEDHQRYFQVWFASNLIFNIIFMAELVINIYGRWWRVFWASGWNKFDFIVVAVSVFDMLPFIPLPGPAKLIKMLRAFRVFRLFSRIESMRKIIASIMKAIPGVANAFFIQLIFLCIYAVLAVEFFSFIGCDVDSESYGFALTARAGGAYLPETDACWGQEYYGTFFRSLYTMFQVLTGESWSEAGARPAIAYYAGQNNLLYVYITYFFFYSFILVNQMTLLNVVVAVLMDGMSQSGPEEDEGSKENTLERVEGKLDQLIADVTDLVKGTERKLDELTSDVAAKTKERDDISGL